MPRDGFSIASVVISYFLVAGGIVLGLLGLAALKQGSQSYLYGAFGAGAFVGGFVAGRASRGSTILEPGLGAILLVASVAAMIWFTPVGKFLWAIRSEEAGKAAGIIAGAAAVGALLGAFLSEKLMGESTRSSLPWILYTALATCGACFAAFLAAFGVLLQNVESIDNEATKDKIGMVLLVGMGAGCFLSGLSVGASTWRRALFASLIGAAGGVLGFFLLMEHLTAGNKSLDWGALAFFAGGGAIVTVVGNLIGWALFGKRGAEEAPTLPYA
jgi:hypothetical protein